VHHDRETRARVSARSPRRSTRVVGWLIDMGRCSILDAFERALGMDCGVSAP
jgi:hypothetical protein